MKPIYQSSLCVLFFIILLAGIIFWWTSPVFSQTIDERDRDTALATIVEFSYQPLTTVGTVNYERHVYDGPDGSGVCILIFESNRSYETICNGPEASFRDYIRPASFQTTTSTL